LVTAGCWKLVLMRNAGMAETAATMHKNIAAVCSFCCAMVLTLAIAAYNLV